MENIFNDLRNSARQRRSSHFAHAPPPTPPSEMIKALENATTNYSTSNTQKNSLDHNLEVMANSKNGKFKKKKLLLILSNQ